MRTARLGDLLRAQATKNAVLAPMFSGYPLLYVGSPFDMPREARVGALGALSHAVPFILPLLIVILPLGFFALSSESAQLRRTAHWLAVAALTRTARAGGHGRKLSMSGAWSYVVVTFTSDWMTTAFIAALFIGGALLFRYGRSRIIAPDSSPLPDQQTWLNRLEFWGALTPETEEDERQRLLRQLTIMMGYLIAGVSLGCIVAAIPLAGLALALGGAGSLARPGFDIANTVLYPAMTIASTLGYLFGARMLSRNRPVDQPRGETRLLRDYCAPRVWALPLALTILAAALLLQASLSAPEVVITWLGQPERVQAPVAGGVVSALIILQALIAVPCARWVATSPNAIIAATPVASQRASDCLRASASGSLVFVMWANCCLILTDMDSLQRALGFPQLDGISGILQGSLMLIGWLMLMGNIMLLLYFGSGRLGGRLTGWPRRHRRPGPGEQAVTAQGRG